MLDAGVLSTYLDSIAQKQLEILYPGHMRFLEMSPDVLDNLVVLSNGVALVTSSIYNGMEGKNILSHLHLKARTKQLSWSLVEANSSDISELRRKVEIKSASKISTGFDMAKRVTEMIEYARGIRTSDIHIFNKGATCSVEMRIDGRLEKIEEFSLGSEQGLNLTRSIYNTHLGQGDSSFDPCSQQDGTFERTLLPAGISGIRVASGPVEGGGLMVLRLQYKTSNSNIKTFEDMGFHPDHIAALCYMLKHPDSINLLTGPTNTGKSLALKIAFEKLRMISKGKRRQITVEDPAEHEFSGIPQISLRSETGSEKDRESQYNRVIAGILRFDPDDIMVGEIRDKQSAEFTIKLAQTGHRVWSTLHCKDNVQVLPRLELMGLDRRLIADSSLISGIVNQRLIAKLCLGCRITLFDAIKAGAFPDITKDYFNNIKIDPEKLWVIGEGCEECRNTGLKAMTVIAEAMVPDDIFMKHYLNDDRPAMRDHAFVHQGWMSKTKHARYLVEKGIIDPFMAEDSVGSLAKEMVEQDHLITMDEVRMMINSDFRNQFNLAA